MTPTPKKKSHLSTRKAQASSAEARKRMSQRRAAQSPSEAETSRAEARKRMSQLRAAQTPSDTETSRAEARQRMSQLRAAQTPSETEISRQADKNRKAAKRAGATSQERAAERSADVARKKIKLQQVQLLQQLQVAQSDVDEHYCGPMTVYCNNCGSKNFSAERPQDKQFSMCCKKGKVRLDSHPYPDFLKRLMCGADPDSKHFMDNIRSYNSAFSFASMGAHISPPPGHGPYCFRIQGQIYHSSIPLHPSEGEPMKYAQLYILDPEEATRQRLAIRENTRCRYPLMDRLGNFMNTYNKFAEAYRMMFEVEKECEERATMNNEIPPTIHMSLLHDRSHDQRRYNAPRSNEVAIIFQNADGEPPLQRDLLIYPRDDPNNPTYKRISITHPSLEPMTYPLFFPCGEPGWHPDIPLIGAQHQRKRVTQMAYYGYRLAVRDDFNPFLNGGKLTQQYFVDAYVKMESNRLNYIRTHHSDFRTATYQALMDHLHSEAVDKGFEVGTPVILPSTFTGSPRNMQQNYQDAMAIVSRYGKPDLFITMTCNPKWKEITENLEPHQTVENRPDLIARVFDLKLKEMIKDVCKNNLLGKHVAHVYVIEFQKRGLPHAHMLVVLAGSHKPRDADHINSLVSAEIPSKTESPRLHEIVTTHMMHGPCGPQHPNAPCMENGHCVKGFPKTFREDTNPNVDGYPLYRRRNTNNTVTIRGMPMDNRWVVPYNKYLSLKYNCHINVEVCASIRSVKYLFKYVYKGHDCANVEITHADGSTTVQRDEVKQHVDARYVSPPEAAWHLLDKRMHGHSHTITRLAVHLEDHQTVCFKNPNPGEVPQPAFKDSTLMAWFKLNQCDPSARKYLYSQIPEHYVFTRTHTWAPRKQGGHSTIGRMYTVNISAGERYYLRLLLLNIPGATSFDYLKTINGVTHLTFKSACIAHGLLEDDSVWEATLQDAACVSMPKALRELFAVICIFGCPRNPIKLWETFLPDFTEDFTHTYGATSSAQTNETFEQLALREVEEVLILHNKHCSDFGLPTPPCISISDMHSRVDQESHRSNGELMVNSLNEDQRSIYNKIMEAIYTPTSSTNCYFLDGPGGSGKTYLYKTLLNVIKGHGDVAIPVASTGIAANLLEAGRTYHSQFKVPLALNESSTSTMKMTSADAHTLRRAKLIIWDEATMASSHAVNVVDKLLQSIQQNSLPFGGMVILLGGDFRQCLPVVPHAERQAIVQSSIKHSKAWHHIQLLKLTNNVRSVDAPFTNWLLKVGNGDITNDYSLGDDIIEVPSDFLLHDHSNIVTNTFGDCLQPHDITRFSNTAILCPRNDDTVAMNEDVLSILQGDEKTYLSIDTVQSEDAADVTNYPTEFLHSLTPSGMPPHTLHLKVGAIVMLLRNLNVKKGLCNGTRLSVTRMATNVITCNVLTGSSTGTTVLIPRIDLAPQNPDLPFTLRRRQFPITLAFSITINKSQGQTMDKVGLYLPQPVFGHGQLYVAFSRVRQSADVKVQVTTNLQQGKLLPRRSNIFTRNVVYKEVFNDPSH